MKIRYKLILFFIFIITIASLPLSLFILKQQEKEKLSLISRQGEINSRILARTTLNILLMNGGDIPSSMVDAKEMISILKPLTDSGMVYADAILLSSQKRYNGIILAHYADESVFFPGNHEGRISNDEINILRVLRGPREISFSGADDVGYEFVSTGSLPGKPAVCIGRLVFSKSVVLAPIKRLRRIIFGSTFFAIVLVSLLGLVFSSFISRPISSLISGVEKIGGGDLDYRVSVKTKDELGILANTFNHLAQIVKLEIDELLTANEELRRLDTLKDEFLANMSHELRTPLYGMIGIAESLVDGIAGDLNRESLHNLNLIISSGRRLSGLVNDILDFSKLKHHDIALSNAPVNMYSVVQLVISIMKPVAEKKSLKLENRIDPESAGVIGDGNRLQQVMLNLIGNAIKFTERGGVAITSEKSDDGKTLTFTVADTGIGIPTDRIDRIFEIFEQGDGSVSRSYGGSGLGLAIARKLIELHGGKIWVEPGPEAGSRFSFTLASVPDVPAAYGETEAMGLYKEDEEPLFNDIALTWDEVKAASGRCPKRILVVDDEPVNIQVLINHLSLEGYTVLTAMDGSEALDKVMNEDVDLVLLDVMLPRMSGYEVCRTIREQYTAHDLPILMLTARNKPGDIVTGLEAGANDYLAKPVNRQELLARVSGLLSLKDSVVLHNQLNLIKRDIQIAHEIQQSILLQEMPKMANVDIAVRYRPMDELGGDFYDVQKIDDSRLGILMADVSGHGIPAAFICVMLKVAYSFHIEDAGDPSLILKKINKTMFNFTGGQFITACYAFIDIDEKRLSQCNAGHWPLLLWRKTSQKMLADRDNFMPLGWSLEEDYRSSYFNLEPGDRIILYTDGIIEARNEKDKMYGEKRFRRVIKESQELDADGCADSILDSVTTWIGDAPGRGHNDDVTLAIVDIFPDDANAL